MISGDARTSEARAWCKEVHRGVTTERLLGRRSQQLHKLCERSDGSRTVLLLALKRLEFAFGSSSSTHGRRGEVTTLPPPQIRRPPVATRKSGEFYRRRRTMALGRIDTCLT